MSLQTIFKDSKGRWRDEVLWKIVPYTWCSDRKWPITHGRKASSTSIDNDAKRSLHRARESAGWLSSSARYGGADPCTHLNTSTASLKSIRSFAFSVWMASSFEMHFQTSHKTLEWWRTALHTSLAWELNESVYQWWRFKRTADTYVIHHNSRHNIL